jgi:hypothetical protein
MCTGTHIQSGEAFYGKVLGKLPAGMPIPDRGDSRRMGIRMKNYSNECGAGMNAVSDAKA